MKDEAHKLGMRVAHHTGVEETNTWDDIRFGTTSIEHWYGIPDAAIERGRQNFPSNYNYMNEVDRFRYAGRLWREANWDRLMKVLDGMVEANVAWNPTLDIYEASRDLQRAQTNPAFAEYLHPGPGRIFPPESCESRFVFHRLDIDRRSFLEGELPDLDAGIDRIRTTRRHDRRRRRCRIYLSNVRLRPAP